MVESAAVCSPHFKSLLKPVNVFVCPQSPTPACSPPSAANLLPEDDAGQFSSALNQQGGVGVVGGASPLRVTSEKASQEAASNGIEL